MKKMKRSASISEILRPLADNPFQAYLSNAVKVADILDIPADVLHSDIADRSTDVSKAYRRGKATSKVKLHS